MTVRSYALLSESAVAAVAARMRSLADGWCRDWGLAPPACACERAWQSPLPEHGWRAALTFGTGMAWLNWSDKLLSQLQAQLFDPDRHHAPGEAEGGLAALAAEAALGELLTLLERLLPGGGAVRAPVDAAPASTRVSGSGAVLTELRFERQSLWVLIDHAAVGALAPASRAPAAPLAEVDMRALLHAQPAKLRVQAGQAIVGMGSLLTLAAGDVIRLDSLTNQPLAVAAPDGRAVLRGYLGSHGRHLALDLVSGEITSGAAA
jgi:flagellar motor switch/type III secretory pathway protein FliN